MSTTPRVSVAYEFDGDEPCYLHVPFEDIPQVGCLDDPESRDELFESLRLEGAITVRIDDGSQAEERHFIPDGSLPPVYIILDSGFPPSPPYTATLQELKGMFQEIEVIESESGLVALNPRLGPLYVGMRVRSYREAVAGISKPVPILLEEGHIPPPNDRTYVFLSAPGRHYRNDPSSQNTPTVRLMEQSRNVIPFVQGKPLWSFEVCDWFAMLGEKQAIEAAQQAIALVGGMSAYNPIQHYQQFARGRQYHNGDATA